MAPTKKKKTSSKKERSTDSGPLSDFRKPKGLKVPVPPPLPSLKYSQWSSTEDIFLIYLRFVAEPPEKLQRIATLYRAQHGQDPENFPKRDMTGVKVQTRLWYIENDPVYRLRFKLLKYIAETQKPENKNPKQGQQPNVKQQIVSSLPVKSSVFKKRDFVGEAWERQRQFGHQKVRVSLVLEDGTLRTVVAPASALAAHSDLLRRLIEEAKEPDRALREMRNDMDVGGGNFGGATAARVSEQSSTLPLDVKISLVEAPYNVALYDSVSITGIKHFVDFSTNPNLLQDIIDVEQALKDVEEENKVRLDALCANVNVEEAEQSKKLSELRHQEESQMSAYMEASLEEEIEELKRKHAQKVEKVLSGVDEKYTTILTDVKEFFDGERKKLVELSGNMCVEESAELHRIRNEMKDSIDSMFKENALMKTLIMCELLEADSMSRSVCDRIALRLDRYLHAIEWGCSLIRETTRAYLLSKLSDKDVLRLSKMEIKPFSQDVLQLEIGYRRKMAQDKYRHYSSRELHAVILEGDETFMDVVHDHLKIRMSERFTVRLNYPLSKDTVRVFDPMTCGDLLAGRYCSVLGTVSRDHKQWGRWYYETTVLQLDSLFGATIAIGWDSYREVTGRHYTVGMIPGDDDMIGIALQSDGFVHAYGNTRMTTTEFGAGDVVGVAIDQDVHAVSFSVNGKVVVTMEAELGTLPHPDSYGVPIPLRRSLQTLRSKSIAAAENQVMDPDGNKSKRKGLDEDSDDGVCENALEDGGQADADAEASADVNAAPRDKASSNEEKRAGTVKVANYTPTDLSQVQVQAERDSGTAAAWTAKAQVCARAAKLMMPQTLWVGENEAEAFLVPSKKYALFPAATMYSVRENHYCKVKFNFTGPFSHCPSGYSAFGGGQEAPSSTSRTKLIF
eukprot:Rmarinus@m.19865